MGTSQSQYIDDVNFTSPKGDQDKVLTKDEERRVALYLERAKKSKQVKQDKKVSEAREDENAAGTVKTQRKHGIRVKHDAIAIADILGYLKAVASHASNLPLTTRDDPGLGRTVSSLTAEQYSTKSKVFIPSDIRVIGGTSLKYDDNWEYPNRREIDLSQKVREFDQEHGGACCNAMLKVLYDNGNDESVVDHNEFIQDNLFDENNEDENYSQDDESIGSIVFDDLQSGSVLSWAGMLRKMKDEMEEIGHKQVPTISASRRFDLNEPFSLVPESFDPSKNKKIALLIGCNYGNSALEISSSHDDIRSMKDYIVNVHGFPEDSMLLLLDDGKNNPPTQINIIRAFEKIASKCKRGDAVFIQFTGHGGRVLDTGVGIEADCYDEVIFPSDFKKAGQIRDTMVFKSLIAPMIKGVTVTILLDSMDTGVILDMPFSWSTLHDTTDTIAKLSLNNNFSFVRILKVLKHMYESSAYHSQSYSYEEGYDDSDSLENASLCTFDGDEDESDDDDDISDDDERDTDKESNSLNESGTKQEESMITTIGGYFKTSTSAQNKVRSMQQEGGEHDICDTGRGNTAINSFNPSNFAETLSAQKLYTQVCSVLNKNKSIEVDSKARKRDIVSQHDSESFQNDDSPKLHVSSSNIAETPKHSITASHDDDDDDNLQHNASFYDDNGSNFVQDSYSDDTLSDSEDDYLPRRRQETFRNKRAN